MNVEVHISFWVTVFISLGWISRVELLDHMEFYFQILRKHCTGFLSGWTNINSDQQFTGSLFIKSFPALIIYRLFDNGHSNRYVVLILSNYWCWVSWTPFYFIYLLVICMYSLGKCLFRSSTHFFLRFFVVVIELWVFFFFSVFLSF